MKKFNRPKYILNKEHKKEFLNGMTLVYISKRTGISYSYLTRIGRGVFPVDDYIIEQIMTCIGYGKKEIKEKKEYYFTRIK